MVGTKERILDTAEQLFGEFGYDGTSLRTITAAADVNVAAVNYHFKSKEELLRAVLTRRVRPVNDQRLAMLNAYEDTLGSAPPLVEDLVRILIAPLMVMASDSGPAAAGFRMLFGRIYSEPSRSIHRIFFQEMREIVRRFATAFQRAMPSIPAVEIYWRLHFAIGATVHTLAEPMLLEAMSGGLCSPSDSKGAVERLIAFAVGGIKAPMPAHACKGSSRAAEADHAPKNKRNRTRSSAR
jgi:AcrR family transcriptional regulator